MNNVETDHCLLFSTFTVIKQGTMIFVCAHVLTRQKLVVPYAFQYVTKKVLKKNNPTNRALGFKSNTFNLLGFTHK